MTGETPDLAGQKVTLRQVLVVISAIIGFGLQALYIVSSISEFKGKLQSERASDVQSMNNRDLLLQQLSSRLMDVDKTVSKIESKFDAQGILLGDARERISSIEEQLRTTTK
jgi:hypothetical protein